MIFELILAIQISNQISLSESQWANKVISLMPLYMLNPTQNSNNVLDSEAMLDVAEFPIQF